MNVKTVPLEVLSVAHPTIIGAKIPLRRSLGSPEEEARIEKIGKTAETSGERLRKALASHTQPPG